jgi:hypothetical protein
MTDCRRDRHRSGGSAYGAGQIRVLDASGMMRDLATLFRGGDDLLIADSEPGVISVNLAWRSALLAFARATLPPLAISRCSSLQSQKMLPAP